MVSFLVSELRVILLGNSWPRRCLVGNFILGQTAFNTEKQIDCCTRIKRQLEEKTVVLINTPDLTPDINEDKLTEYINNCVELSNPGPHLFLLVLQPEDLTAQFKQRLESFLELFSCQSFHHSLVIISTSREKSSGLIEKYMQHPLVGDMIRKCNKWLLWQTVIKPIELFTVMDLIIKENNRNHVNPPTKSISSETLQQVEAAGASWEQIGVAGKMNRFY